MKFYCDTEKLNSALNMVSRAVEINSVSPHMQGVLFIAEGGSLTLKGNNMETGIETTIPSNVAESGRAVMNCKMICDIVKRLPKDVVEIALNEKNNILINCINSDYTIMGLSADEYPDIPEIDSDKRISISSSVLKDMINKTIFAVSTNPDEIRRVLKGSLFEAENDSLTIVSLDLVRMALIKKETESSTEENMKFIVPGKTLNDLKSMLKDDDESTVTITVGENQALFDCGSFKLTTRLIDGEYFSYKQIIPQQFKSEFTVDSQAFIKTIERVEPIIENVNKNSIKFIFTDGKIKIKCETQLGKVNDFVECDYDDEETTVGFNYKFIHDAVARCEDERILFRFNSPLSPIIISCPEDESYLFMVLPVRL